MTYRKADDRVASLLTTVDLAQLSIEFLPCRLRNEAFLAGYRFSEDVVVSVLQMAPAAKVWWVGCLHST